LRVREVSKDDGNRWLKDEGNRLLKIVRRSSGSLVTCRRAQMVLLSVQGMDVAGIAGDVYLSRACGPSANQQPSRLAAIPIPDQTTQ
jgi:hypothetical protein